MKMLLTILYYFWVSLKYCFVIGAIFLLLGGQGLLSDEVKEVTNQNLDLYQNQASIFSAFVDITKDLESKTEKAVSVETKPTYDYLKSITVRIESRKKTDPKHGWIGTGVIIAVTDTSTIILTNRHVRPHNDADHDFFVVEDGVDYPLINIKVSKIKEVDLSLNKIEGFIPNKQAVKAISDVKPQDHIFMVGMNLGRDFFYSEGYVAGISPNDDNALVIDSPSGPGNSGSGIINQQGNLVGLLFAGNLLPVDLDGEPFDLVDYLDLAHGLCVQAKDIRLFLAGYSIVNN